MKVLKNNFKLIIGFFIGVILAGGITVCAYSLYAQDIGYTLETNNYSISNVEEALNKLYEQLNKTPTLTDSRGATGPDNGTYATVSNLEINKYYICSITTRKAGTLSITGAEKLFSNAQIGYLDGNYGSHLALIYTTSSSVRFNVSGTKGVQARCWLLQ